jgi:hypothetical protein
MTVVLYFATRSLQFRLFLTLTPFYSAMGLTTPAFELRT